MFNNVRIMAGGKTYFSTFDWRTVIEPGVRRIVADVESREEAWRVVYCKPHEFDIIWKGHALHAVVSDKEFFYSVNSDSALLSGSGKNSITGINASSFDEEGDSSYPAGTAGEVILAKMQRMKKRFIMDDPDYFEIRSTYEMLSAEGLEDAVYVLALSFPILRFAD